MVQAQVLDAAVRPGARARRRPDDDQPRPVRAGDDLRPGRGDVRRTDRRGGPGRRRLFADPVAPVHPSACPAPSRRSATRVPAGARRSRPATRRTRTSCRPAARSTRAARSREPRCAEAPTVQLGRCGGPRGARPASDVGSDPAGSHERRPVLEVRDLKVTFQRPGSAAARRGPSTASTCRCAGRDRRTGRRVRLRQDDAGSRDPGPAAPGQRPGALRRPSLALLGTGAEGLPARGPAGPAGPDRCAEPAAHGVRGGRRGPAHPPVPGDEQTLVAEALSRAGLRPPERFFLRYPHELSGGQRQRVVIAGALVLEPTVIVADEPVSSLDASVRGEILALLLRLRDELGLTVLVVTHDLGLAWNIADRIAVMYLGRIVELGTTEEVLARPAAPVHPGTAVGGPGDRARRAGRADR